MTLSSDLQLTRATWHLAPKENGMLYYMDAISNGEMLLTPIGKVTRSTAACDICGANCKGADKFFCQRAGQLSLRPWFCAHCLKALNEHAEFVSACQKTAQVFDEIDRCYQKGLYSKDEYIVTLKTAAGTPVQGGAPSRLRTIAQTSESVTSL